MRVLLRLNGSALAHDGRLETAVIQLASSMLVTSTACDVGFAARAGMQAHDASVFFLDRSGRRLARTRSASAILFEDAWHVAMIAPITAHVPVDMK